MSGSAVAGTVSRGDSGTGAVSTVMLPMTGSEKMTTKIM